MEMCFWLKWVAFESVGHAAGGPDLITTRLPAGIPITNPTEVGGPVTPHVRTNLLSNNVGRCWLDWYHIRSSFATESGLCINILILIYDAGSTLDIKPGFGLPSEKLNLSIAPPCLQVFCRGHGVPLFLPYQITHYGDFFFFFLLLTLWLLMESKGCAPDIEYWICTKYQTCRLATCLHSTRSTLPGGLLFIPQQQKKSTISFSR